MVHCLPSVQPYPYRRQNIPVCLPGSEVPERNPSGFCQFHFLLVDHLAVILDGLLRESNLLLEYVDLLFQQELLV